jgi:hypothetical protein
MQRSILKVLIKQGGNGLFRFEDLPMLQDHNRLEGTATW